VSLKEDSIAGVVHDARMKTLMNEKKLLCHYRYLANGSMQFLLYPFDFFLNGFKDPLYRCVH
jgi:hypothetical protein